MAAAKITALEKRMEALKDENAEMRNRIAILEASIEKIKISDVAPPAKKAKKEHKPRGSSAWNLFAKKVHADMKAANPDAKFKAPEIAQEAKRRKDAGEYDEAHWKTVLEKTKASSSASEAEVTAVESEAEAKSEAEVKSEAEAKPVKKHSKKTNKKD